MIILKGIIEYRGYDSSGAVLLHMWMFIKKKGAAVLEGSVGKNLHANIGIGHTRWATWLNQG
jgi:glucosamine--fructose-6-phosphate aminotransferase (isomerizing)